MQAKYTKEKITRILQKQRHLHSKLYLNAVFDKSQMYETVFFRIILCYISQIYSNLFLSVLLSRC